MAQTLIALLPAFESTPIGCILPVRVLAHAYGKRAFRRGLITDRRHGCKPGTVAYMLARLRCRITSSPRPWRGQRPVKCVVLDDRLRWFMGTWGAGRVKRV